MQCFSTYLLKHLNVVSDSIGWLGNSDSWLIDALECLDGVIDSYS